MTTPLYFECVPSCLDIFTLSYRWFGAVWTEEAGNQTVLAFWFGNDRQDILDQAQREGWGVFVQTKDQQMIQRIYQQIRSQQRVHDWNKCSRLPIHKAFTKPWKDVKPGWYVIRSRQQFPFYVSAIRRERYSMWMQHVGLCENQRELDHFLEQVNGEHGISLKMLSLVEQCTYPCL